MIYYTSDLHFFHDNIIRLCKRPFNSVDEMNKELIKNWNKKVSSTDTVYILGDLILKYKTIEEVKAILNSLHGHKYLIKGNHDKFLSNIKSNDFFDGVYEYKEIHDNKRKVILFHYPIEEWNGFYKGSFHLFGHIHNTNNNYKQIPNRYNVGVDVCNFEPKTLDELVFLFNKEQK